MARLSLGENPKIDKINEYVRLVQQGNAYESNESLTALLGLFKPLMLKLCKKWSDYFNNNNTKIKSFEDAVDDCIYWFYNYTKNVYVIDGKATYNKFIKDHLDQRIRYIYECELKHHSRILYPDSHGTDNDNIGDMLDDIIYKYSPSAEISVLEKIEISECQTAKSKLFQEIHDILNSDIYNDRERDIFWSIICSQQTHEQLGEKYDISRTRVTQILAKIKDKLYKEIEGNATIWQLLDDADIDITNSKLM